MPVLSPTNLTAVVTFLGINTDAKDLSTTPIDEANVSYGGFEGDIHYGLTRKSCTRIKIQYPVGTEIRNTRQISAISQEEVETIKTMMQIDELDPTWIGANLLLSGIHDFSKIPPSSRLIAENGTSMVVDMENAPCRFPGDIIDKFKPGKGRNFAKCAMGKRGVTLWVEKEGKLKVGDTLHLHIPPECHWKQN